MLDSHLYALEKMNIEVKIVKNRADLATFVKLPSRIHHGHDKWMPPILRDEFRSFNIATNPAFFENDTILAIAWQNNRPVGRIAGIIHRRYNESMGEKTARFSYLECEENIVIAKTLLDFVENWVKDRGMTKIIGPKGFSNQDPQGFLVEGFGNEPSTEAFYNFEYIVHFLNDLEYVKEVDYVVYKIQIPEKPPELYRKISNRFSRRTDFHVIEFTRKKELQPFIIPVFHLMNETYRHLPGYVVLSEQEMLALAKRFLPIIDPRFVKLVTFHKQAIAFIIGIPNMNAGLRKANGHLFPFGLFYILHSRKTSRQMDLMLGAEKPEFRGKGIDALMGSSMVSSAHAAGFDFLDTNHELEDNIQVRSEMERVGGVIYKRYRIFQKSL
ncbi:MAG: hypothetical protein COT43_07785 [Candidatus Marinimicrobia bacterium CG08_land_8_20_14_0_20_45_22]|nr:MAG: hypothetical protein COT43_07785 [Candidatus Marinimicrobia bacterium CG08_land_8_20_14_0_20_45_22]